MSDLQEDLLKSCDTYTIGIDAKFIELLVELSEELLEHIGTCLRELVANLAGYFLHFMSFRDPLHDELVHQRSRSP